MLTLALTAASPEELAQDPATAAVWAYLQRHAPLRPGDKATLFRFWMGEEAYQLITPVQGLIGVAMVWHYLTAPNLAFTFFPCADPDFWAPLCAHARLDRLLEADYEIGGRRYGVYGHDWRAMPPLAWLTLMAGQEFGLAAVVRATGASTPAPPPQTPVEPLAVLSYPDFAAAIREALRNLTLPQHLLDNPLLRSRLVVEASKAAPAGVVRATTGASAPAEVLRALLIQTVESLQVAPRQTKLYRALYHTYLHPAPSQEQAAELLDLPYSTFRRHLKAGVEQVTRLLWERELGA